MPDPAPPPDANPGHATQLAEVLREAPWMAQNLPRYDRWGAARLLAGLLTCPECHANTIRLEALVHLAVALGRGTLQPRRDDLIIWFNRHFREVRLRRLEDPIEDVFVSNVIDGTGNHRIFEGLWERNDFWLQSLIDVFPRLPVRPEYDPMRHSVRALLDLSDALAERNELTRNLEGGGEPKGQVYLPDRDELATRADTVVFSAADLAQLGIDPAALAPFVWSDDQNATILTAEMENSPLERRPLLRRDDAYLLVLPSACSIAIRRFVLETVEAQGDLLHLDTLLNQRHAEAVTKRGLARLEAETWEAPGFPGSPGRSPVSLTLAPFRFDTDKFGLLCVVSPPLRDALRLGFGKFEDVDNRWTEAEALLLPAVQFVANAPGFRAGLLLFVGGGLGTPLSFPFPTLPPAWQIACYSVPNFLGLAMLPDVDMLMIWRLATQEARARERGVRIINPNGDFNLMASWRANEFTLVPDNAPVGERPILVAPEINALLRLRHETRSRLDLHAARRNQPARWLEVERKSAHSPFSESRRMPFYVVPALASRGELAGVVEAPGATWWVTGRLQPQTPNQRSLFYQLWDCVGHWLVPVARVLSERFAPAGAVLEIEIDLLDLARWIVEGRLAAPAEPVPLAWERTPVGVRLMVTEAFFRSFAQPTNAAEREIVSALLAAGTLLLGQTAAAEEIAHWRDTILPEGDARYFHVTVENDASFVATPGPADPYFVRQEVFSEVNQELGRAIAPELRGRFSDERQEVRKQVRAAVAHLKDNIAARLRALGLAGVVRRSLTVLDSLHRDQHSWNVSAAALFALTADREELLAEAQRQESKRAGTNLAARALIETALFTCATEGGEDMSDSTLDELLAMTQVLVRIADYDQPVRADFPAGRVSFTHSGTFKVRNDFLESVRTAYMSSSFEESFTAAADAYADHFDRGTGAVLPDDLAQFNAAVTAEFGLNCEQIVQVGEALNELGGEQGRSVLEMRRSELVTLLAGELAVPAEQIRRFLTALRIYPRSAWDAELPADCEPKDVFPWLFKRRFSLLRRPFIEVDRADDPRLLVSPLLVRHGLRYLIGTAHTGDFPPNYFRTEEMRRFQQHAVDRRSRNFVTEVANVLTTAGYTVRPNVPMTALGAPATLGDIDVLAWRVQPRPEAPVLECKALRNARSTSEILSQLDQFRGEAGDLLDKHQQRLKWLRENPAALAGFIGHTGLVLKGAVVTSHQVPMQFLPTGQGAEHFLDLSQITREFGTV